MQFKKVDVLISENLTKAQLKEKVLTELNKISKESNPSISYIANIHDIVNGKYWICMDSETKETMGATDELIDLQAIFRHTTENPDEASRDLLYSSKYIEDNFLRKIIFETYKEANDSRLNKLETTVDTNEKDIEDKHYKLEKRVLTAENTITDNKELEDTRYSEYTQFKKNIENNILSINNNLNTKANLGGSETQVFNVADPTSDWHAINLAYAKKNFNADLINKHKTDFNNPHRTTISNLHDTTISTPKVNQALVYNGTKWINKDVSLDDSNYAKKNEANIFTKKQSGIDGTEDANFVTLRQLKTKVGLTGNETIGGNKTFSSPITIPTATANNHSLPLGQADGRYAKLLTQNLEWTVGTGGKFTDLNSAIIEANNYYSPDLNKTITLKIMSNITINNRVAIFRGGCRVIVTCDNSNVVITVNKNNTNSYNYTFAGFGFEFRSVNINIVGASTDTHNGTLFSFGDFKIYNLKVTGSPCMIIHNNGSTSDNEYFRTNAVISNLVVEYNSRMTQALVYLGNNGSLYIGGTKESNIISNAGIGFVSRSGSNITLSSGITCNNIGTLFRVDWGGIISINAPSSDIILNGAIKTNQPSLTPTKAGLIFDSQN